MKTHLGKSIFSANKKWFALIPQIHPIWNMVASLTRPTILQLHASQRAIACIHAISKFLGGILAQTFDIEGMWTSDPVACITDKNTTSGKLFRFNFSKEDKIKQICKTMVLVFSPIPI